ncbi:MAG: glycosyltransferase family 2 protein [Candidatus Pacearchaeota archaeon]|jgi:glycosyltransferase involved in cell wall biosynthesis
MIIEASVIIPAYNEENYILSCLKSIENQSYKKAEIIVVDDGSTDNTKEIIRDFSKKSKIKISLLEQNHGGPGKARNLGAKQAKGKILLFVDADMTFDKEYVKLLVKPILEGKTIGTEEKTQRANNLDNIWSKCWGMYVKGYPETRKKGNVFRAISKEKFIELGGFDSKYGYADDRTFYFKYGLVSDLVEGAICYHRNSETLKEVYKQSRWIGASYKIAEIPIINYFIPLIMILISPIMIILMSIRKCYKLKKYSLFIPWMLIFMTARYFGAISGIIRKVYLGKNFK